MLKLRHFSVLLLFVGFYSSADAAPREHLSARGLSVCDMGNGPRDDVPGNSLEALRGLIAVRVACQNELTQSIDTGLESMADEFDGDGEVHSIHFARGSLVALQADISSFHGEVLSPEADSLTLDLSLTRVLFSVDTMSGALQIVGDDAQLANVDMQNWLQKQQQTLQMMANISKMIHDNAMSVIRKIGG